MALATSHGIGCCVADGRVGGGGWCGVEAVPGSDLVFGAFHGALHLMEAEVA